MSNMLKYKGYTTRVEYSVEDQVLHGKIEGISDLVDFESDSLSEIENAFHSAVDDYLDFCASVGKNPSKEFSGSFNVRTDPKTHRDLYMIASKNDCSLNQIVHKALRDYCDQEEQRESIAAAQFSRL